MVKKIFLICLISLFICGCGWEMGGKPRVPQGNTGAAGQKDTEKTKVYGDIEGEFVLPEEPLMDSAGAMQKPLKFRIDGVDAEVPAGTKGKFKMSASGKSTTSSFTEITSKWQVNSAPTQLFVFGGFMIAAGIILMFFGMWWLGMGLSIGGGSLIACGIMINQYPWVILIVIGVCLICAAYYLYVELNKKKLSGENQDTSFVLSELVDILSDVPNDILEKYIKQPLREHDQSSLIREITKKARFRN